MNTRAEKKPFDKIPLETAHSKIIASTKKAFRKERTADFWDDLSLEQRKEIENASLEIKNGAVVCYNSFMQKHR